MPSKGWIGVDLDGTLAEYYHGTYDPSHVGKPIMPMVEKVREWLKLGYEVRIFTARANPGNWPGHNPNEVNRAILAIEVWCVEQFGQILRVTCSKNCEMVALFDDRVFHVEHNTGRIIGEGNFLESENCFKE